MYRDINGELDYILLSVERVRNHLDKDPFNIECSKRDLDTIKAAAMIVKEYLFGYRSWHECSHRCGERMG